jgi:hypothetical protein
MNANGERVATPAPFIFRVNRLTACNRAEKFQPLETAAAGRDRPARRFEPFNGDMRVDVRGEEQGMAGRFPTFNELH